MFLYLFYILKNDKELQEILFTAEVLFERSDRENGDPPFSQATEGTFVGLCVCGECVRWINGINVKLGSHCITRL